MVARLICTLNIAAVSCATTLRHYRSSFSRRRMSIVAKVTFGLCCAVSVGIITYVHYKQAYEREQLHLGVIRDIERRERRKTENVYILQQQIELAKELRREEAIRENDT